MTPFPRVVSALLFLAVFSSSVEVLFGDRDAVAAVAADAGTPSGAVAGPAATVTASPSDSGEPAEDCACLCACVCAGAQLVAFAPGKRFEPVIPALDLPTSERAGPGPLPARRPPFRPPLG